MKTETIQAPVTIDGVTIAPGDVVGADETGAVILPFAAVADVLAQCAAIVVEEARLERLPDWSKG